MLTYNLQKNKITHEIIIRYLSYSNIDIIRFEKKIKTDILKVKRSFLVTHPVVFFIKLISHSRALKVIIIYT